MVKALQPSSQYTVHCQAMVFYYNYDGTVSPIARTLVVGMVLMLILVGGVPPPPPSVPLSLFVSLPLAPPL